MGQDSERARRLALRRGAKNVAEKLRSLARDLAEYERLADADPFGVVRIQTGESEAEYGPDVLDMVAQATREAEGGDRVVEVFVLSTAKPIHRASGPIGGSNDRQQRTGLRRRRAGARA